MIPSLASASRAIRRYAAQILGIEDADQLGSFLLESMERGTVPVRQAVSETLGALYGRSQFQADNSDAESLAGLPFLDCLRIGIDDPDEITRANSAKSLGSLLKDSLAVETLVRALSDASVQVRVEAAKGLGRHWNTKEGQLATPALILALADPEPRVREQAAAALEYMHNEEARGPLLPLLEDEDEEVRTRAVLALGALGAPESVPLLIAVLREFESRFGPSAARYLCRMRAEEALPVLKRSLQRYFDVGLQRAVVKSIAAFGSDEVVPPICRALELGGDPKFRQDAIEVLSELGDRSAVPVLIQAMNRWGDRTAMPVLLKLGGREAEDAVIRQLNDGYDDRVSERAASLLGYKGITWAMPALRQALELGDSSYSIQIVAKALSQLGDTITGPEMAEWLLQGNSDQRWRAAIALGELGDGSVKEVLLNGLRDPDVAVQREAAANENLL